MLAIDLTWKRVKAVLVLYREFKSVVLLLAAGAVALALVAAVVEAGFARTWHYAVTILLAVGFRVIWVLKDLPIARFVYGPPRTRLHSLAATACISKLTPLVESSEDLNVPDFEGNTPLHYAATRRDGDTSVTRLLLTNGADVNAENAHGRTPLHLAAGRLNTAIARVLLEQGADQNRKSEVGDKPIDLCKRAASVYRLLRNKDDLRRPITDGALSRGNDRENEESSVNGNSGTPKARSAESLILLFAIAAVLTWGVVKVVPLLWHLVFGTTVGYVGFVAVIVILWIILGDAGLALHYAAAKGSVAETEDALKWLIEPKDIDKRNLAGDTPLHCAVTTHDDRHEVARLLLEAGADVNRRNNKGETALSLAIEFLDPVLVRVLLEYGGDPREEKDEERVPEKLDQRFDEMACLLEDGGSGGTRNGR